MGLSTINKSTFMVTGGAGFIGSHIVDKLLTRGHEVIIVDDLSTGDENNINRKAKFYRVDVSDEKAIRSVFTGHKIDYVIHQAAKINLNVMLEIPSADVNSSVLSTLNMLKCCVDFKVKKFIYASSVAVYGRPDKLPAAETDPDKPIYSYGIVKKCAEDYVRYYSDNYGLDYTILRYANVYGPRQPIYGEVGVIAIYTKRVKDGEPLVIYGDGNQLRDYIYISDVVDVTLKVVGSGCRETFNVGCGKGVSVNEVYEAFCKVNVAKPKVLHKPERIGEIGKFYCDTSKLMNRCAFQPKVSIEQGIEKTLACYLDKKKDRADNDGVLRPATDDDKRMIFEWRNTPFLVQLGGSGKTVTWEDHSKWYDKVLSCDKTKIYIVCYGGSPIGQVRFDPRDNKIYSVTIYLLEEHVGKGLGTIALAKGIELMQNENGAKGFIANVREGNRASIAAFSKNGFIKRRDGINALDGCVSMEYALSPKRHDTELLITFYDENLRKYKNDIRSVAWGSRQSQKTRFRVISKIDDLDGKTILDVGCGLGDFYGWSKTKSQNLKYTGIDITPSMIDVARNSYSDGEFHVGSIFDYDERTTCYDYVIASGIFNLRISNHEKYVRDTIARMFDISRLGVAFNVMSNKADFMEENEYYADPGEMLNFCLGLSRKVIIKHDYMPHDFTVYIYKT